MNKIENLIGEIIKLNKLQGTFLLNALNEMERTELSSLALYIDFLNNQGITNQYLASCYDVIVKDTMREQVFFLKHKRYRHSSFSEVCQSVYFNDEYMRMYMYGLALTTFFWKNHLWINRWFMGKIPKNKNGSYLEIGPGHGYNFMSAMQQTSFDSFEGIDISPASINLTQSILSSGIFGIFNNYSVYEADFLKYDFQKKFDAIIMGEVLEHVEEPLLFLRKIRKLTKPDAFIFITTAINAPAIDHIYLFDSVESIYDLIKKSQMKVFDELIIPYSGKTIAESMQAALPVNIALVLKVD